MADARVIPMDGDRNGTARPRRRGADSVLAGADRATGERARRRSRTTPLLAARDPEAVTDDIPTPAEVPAAKRAAKRAPAGTARKAATQQTSDAGAQPPVERTAEAPASTPAAQAPAAQAPAKKATAKKATAKATAKKATAKKVPDAKAPPKVAVKKTATAKTAPARTAAAETAAEQNAVNSVNVAELKAEQSATPRRDAERVPPAWAAAAQADARSRTAGPGPAAVVREPLDDLPTGGTGRWALAASIAGQAGSMLLDALQPGRRVQDAEAAAAGALEFLRRRLSGEYDVDEFGFDPEFAEAVIGGLLRPIYDRWFRVEVRGIENIPATGGALIVANHSGSVPLDAMMTAVAVHDETPSHRFLRALGADLVFQTPFLAGFARKGGVTLATSADAERLLAEGNVVGVWPEGFKGIGKPFTERYKLQRFGRGGFVSAAMRTRTPIVPCSIVGAEEIFPIIADVPALARLLGLPYVPITPFFPWLGPLGAIPLPSKWLIEFGTPIPTDEYGPEGADDPMLVFDITDRVRQNIQQTLYALLVQRRSIFF